MKDTEIVSKTGMIDKSDESIYNFISDLRNLDKIIPPDVENWTSEEKSCSFSAKGQFITLNIVDEEPHKTVKISGEHASSKPFNFWIQLKGIGDYKTAVRIVLRAKLNMFEKMAVKKPLQNGLDTIIDYMKMIPY